VWDLRRKHLECERATLGLLSCGEVLEDASYRWKKGGEGVESESDATYLRAASCAAVATLGGSSGISIRSS
jgi:hypothetical protein